MVSKMILIALAVLTSTICVPAQSELPDNNEANINRKADSILTLMTTGEKIGQLSIFGSNRPDLKVLIQKGLAGGTNGMLPGKQDVSLYLTGLQKTAMQSRLKIPLLFMGDVIHGYRTTFPVNIAMACSWDTALIRRVDSVAAFEATADGMNWTFAPMVDISRDPRWGRVVEGAGEDPFLASAIAATAVKGFQGNNLANPRTMAATAKHFAAYGAVEAGRDYNTVDMSWRRFHEIYLPPFRGAIDAGVASVMPAFISLNGIPASENKHLLKEILRKACGFKGLLVSDYDAIPEILEHRVATAPAEAAEQAMEAGVDMDLHSGTYLQVLPQLIQSGRVSNAALDSAVKRVLIMKLKLGLFSHPFLYGDRTAQYQDTLLASHRAIARQMAGESMVLLKNDRLSDRLKTVLPLPKNIKSLAVIGPLVKDKKEILGPVHAVGRPEEAVSVWEGIQAAVSPGTHLLYAKGTDIESQSTTGFAEAVAAAKKADAVLMAVGESAGMSGEGDSRSMLGLPGNQLELVKAIVQTGKPVIMLLMSGRPLAIPWLAGHVSAILQTWLSGTETGSAVADIVFGDVNPSAKLVMSFPRNTGQIPIYYNHLNTGRPFVQGNKYTTRYIDIPNTPLFPFGYGLSYTHFTYSAPHLNTDSLGWNSPLSISVKITNRGTMSGTEIVQLYISDMVATLSPMVKSLKGFKRINLKPRQTRTITFFLTRKDLAFYHPDMSLSAEPGAFEVYVGGNADTDNKASFWLLKK